MKTPLKSGNGLRHLAQHFSYRSPGPAATGILKRACVVVLLALSMNMFASAQAPPADLSKLSVEDLMNIEVSSVSKKEQKISQAAAAIFVITKEDISRSGALNIPDLLRMVPGLNVAQINANTWAINCSSCWTGVAYTYRPRLEFSGTCSISRSKTSKESRSFEARVAQRGEPTP